MKILINGKTVEVDNEVITKAIEDEKESIEVKSDELSIRSKEEEDKFIENLKKETGKTSLEMAIKEARNDLGLDFQGKTMENLIEALKEKHREEFTKEPSEQVESLSKDLEKLKERNKELENKSEMTAKEFQEYKNNLKRRQAIESNLPDNLAYTKDDMLLIIDNKIKTTVDESGNTLVLDKDGNVKKDSNLDPITLDKEFENFFSENKQYLKTPEGGRGGGDSSTEVNSKSLEAFNKRMETKGVQPNSVEYNRELAKAQEAKELEI